MNQLGKAEVQPELLNPFDKKGHLIGENNQAVPYLQTSECDTGISDLDPVNTNYDFGIDPCDDAAGTTTDVYELDRRGDWVVG